MSMSRPIRVGDVFRSNNPRDEGIEAVVIKVDVQCRGARVEIKRLRRSYVDVDKFHDDGKPRRNGYSLVESGPEPKGQM